VDKGGKLLPQEGNLIFRVLLSSYWQEIYCAPRDLHDEETPFVGAQYMASGIFCFVYSIRISKRGAKVPLPVKRFIYGRTTEMSEYLEAKSNGLGHFSCRFRINKHIHAT